MSAGGLQPISESPVDSLKDSDQFSIKVRLHSAWLALFKEKVFPDKVKAG